MTRNENYHKQLNKSIPTELPILRAIEFTTLTGKSKYVTPPTIQHINWIPPENRYKLNTNGSFLETQAVVE